MFRGLLAFLVFALMTSSAHAAGPVREMLRERLQQRQAGEYGPTQVMEMAGLKVAYWLPDAAAYPAPLVIFSHGLNGCKTQSVFLMQAMARHGYIVVAPDHKDAMCGGAGAGGGMAAHRPQAPLANYATWSDKTYADRKADIMNLYAALKTDPAWSARIDWNSVALSGHSMGGYTAIGLAGGWPSWKMHGIKSVLALSPYVAPIIAHSDLSQVDVPVMYQTGTRDLGVKPSLVRKGGAFELTHSPAWLVEFDKTGHFGFTDMQKGSQQAIIDYSLWFLDHTLKGGTAPIVKEKGVTDLRVK